MSDRHLEKLWAEYSLPFSGFDDVTLARWLSQTLGQLEGRAWRLSHPLVNCYRLASQVAHKRQIWLKLLANPPAAFAIADCCRAPGFPLFTRDVVNSGLLCQSCEETLTNFDDIPGGLQKALLKWVEAYNPAHQVAHREEEPANPEQYEMEFEEARKTSIALLKSLEAEILPALLEHYPAVVWEDQDECLEVSSEQIV